MDIIFKGIKTPRNCYIYDRGRNAILAVSDSEYEELERLQRGLIKEEDSEVLKKYQNEGFLCPNTVTRIEHPCSGVLGHYLKNHVEKLTLQVTQRCNLRCEYCIYSGNYDNRQHSDLDMSFETAKKAIDLYLRSSGEMGEYSLGFYGGEPLLNLKLIKQCVEYAKSKTLGRKIGFAMTTNATLLNDEVVDYLQREHFKIMISLDGSKKDHDRHRKFQNGKGSFDVIQKNLKRIRERYPQFFANITYNSVINPDNDYQSIKSYFERDELLNSAEILTTIVESENPGEKVKLSEDFLKIDKYDQLKLYLFMLGKLDKKDVSKLVLIRANYIIRKYNEIIKKAEIGSTCHHNGPCIPGTRRLFVSAQGDLFPCERISETSPIMKLGDVQDGFDVEKVRKLLNVGQVTADLCKKCWALLHCNQCIRNADGKNHLSRKLKMRYCPDTRQEAYFSLKEICVLRELGCIFERSYKS